MHNAPYDDPDVEIWGIARHQGWTPRVDVLFEMHAREIWGDYLGEFHYAHKLNQLGIPIWMREHHADIKMSRAFPFDVAEHWFGHYYTGSPSYMLALAVIEGVDRLELYGINGKDRAEYVYQRPNLEFILGVATGLGIDVRIDPNSALLGCDEPYGSKKWYDLGADHALKAHAADVAGVVL